MGVCSNQPLAKRKLIENICQYGFSEYVDYQAINQKRLTAQGNETTLTDHQITIDMAKEREGVLV